MCRFFHVALISLEYTKNRVLLSGDAQANRLAVPGGLSVELVEKLFDMLKERFELYAAAITSFDPTFDKNDIVLSAGIRLIEAFVV